MISRHSNSQKHSWLPLTINSIGFLILFTSLPYLGSQESLYRNPKATKQANKVIVAKHQNQFYLLPEAETVLLDSKFFFSILDGIIRTYKIHPFSKHIIYHAYQILAQFTCPIARINSSKIRDLQVAATYPLLCSPLISLI